MSSSPLPLLPFDPLLTSGTQFRNHGADFSQFAEHPSFTHAVDEFWSSILNKNRYYGLTRLQAVAFLNVLSRAVREVTQRPLLDESYESIIEPLTPNGYLAYREFVQLLLRLAGMWSMGCSPVSFARFLDSIFGKFLEINMQSNRKENALVSNSMDEDSARQKDLIDAQDSQNPTNIMELSNSEDRALSFHDGSSSSDVIHRVPSATITSPLRPRTREHFSRPGSSIVMSNAIPKRPQSTPSRLYVSKNRPHAFFFLGVSGEERNNKDMMESNDAIQPQDSLSSSNDENDIPPCTSGQDSARSHVSLTLSSAIEQSEHKKQPSKKQNTQDTRTRKNKYRSVPGVAPSRPIPEIPLLNLRPIPKNQLSTGPSSARSSSRRKNSFSSNWSDGTATSRYREYAETGISDRLQMAMNVTTCAKSRHYDKKIAEYVLLERRGILPSQAVSLSVSDLASCLVDPCDPKTSASVPVHPDRFQRNFLKSATLSIAHAVMPSTVTPSLYSSEAGFASAPVPAPPSGSRPKRTRKNRRRGFRRPVSQGVDRSVGTNEGSDDISPLLRFHVSSENSFVHPRSRITSPSQQFEVGNVPLSLSSRDGYHHLASVYQAVHVDRNLREQRSDYKSLSFERKKSMSSSSLALEPPSKNFIDGNSMNEQKDLEEKTVLVSHIEQVPFSHSEKACERAIGFSEDDVVLMSARKQVENAGTLAYMNPTLRKFNTEPQQEGSSNEEISSPAKRPLSAPSLLRRTASETTFGIRRSSIHIPSPVKTSSENCESVTKESMIYPAETRCERPQSAIHLRRTKSEVAGVFYDRSSSNHTPRFGAPLNEENVVSNSISVVSSAKERPNSALSSRSEHKKHFRRMSAAITDDLSWTGSEDHGIESCSLALPDDVTGSGSVGQANSESNIRKLLEHMEELKRTRDFVDPFPTTELLSSRKEHLFRVEAAHPLSTSKDGKHMSRAETRGTVGCLVETDELSMEQTEKNVVHRRWSSSLLSSDDEYIPSTSGFTIMDEDSSNVVQEIETLSAVADDHSNRFSVSQVIDPAVENDVGLRKVMRDRSISETSIRSALSSTLRRDATGRDSIILNTHSRKNFLPELQEKKPKRSIEKEFSFLQRYDPTKHGDPTLDREQLTRVPEHYRNELEFLEDVFEGIHSSCYSSYKMPKNFGEARRIERHRFRNVHIDETGVERPPSVVLRFGSQSRTRTNSSRTKS